jgi:hypothetical protein
MNGGRICGHAFYREKGEYLSSELVTRPSSAFDFIAKLAQETGCDVAYAEGGGGETAEQFLASYPMQPEVLLTTMPYKNQMPLSPKSASQP